MRTSGHVSFSTSNLKLLEVGAFLLQTPGRCIVWEYSTQGSRDAFEARRVPSAAVEPQRLFLRWSQSAKWDVKWTAGVGRGPRIVIARVVPEAVSEHLVLSEPSKCTSLVGHWGHLAASGFLNDDATPACVITNLAPTATHRGYGGLYAAAYSLRAALCYILSCCALL